MPDKNMDLYKTMVNMWVNIKHISQQLKKKKM